MSDQTTPGRASRAPLRRDRRSKVIAGVCGGLGRHLDIDPVVFRILFAVLSFVGGLGLLAYAAAWLFVPAEGARKSEAHRLLTDTNPLLAVIVSVGLALGALASISALTNGFEGEWPVWMIAAAVLGVLVWRGDIKLARGDRTRTPQQPPTWWQQPVGEAPDGHPGTGGAAGSGGGSGGDSGGNGAGAVDAAGQPQDAAPAGFATYAAGESAPENAAWVDLSGFGSGPTAGPAAAGGAEPARRAGRRGYGGLVLASLLAATGIVGVLDAAGLISLTWLSAGALVLVMLGGGMTLGGMFGKTTALVPIGLVVAVPLIVLAAADVPLHGTVGDENWTPSSAAAVQSSYTVGVGDGTLDLSNVVPGAGQTRAVSAEVGIGELIVQVPPDVTVHVHAHTGIGDIQQDTADTSGTATGGVGRTEDFVIPAQGGSHGTLVLTLTTDIGDVQVDGQ